MVIGFSENKDFISDKTTIGQLALFPVKWLVLV